MMSVITLIVGLLGADGQAGDVKAALKPFNGLVGTWKGTATPTDKASKRQRLFWRETSEWKWSLAKDRVGLVWTVTDGKRIKSGFLTFDPADKLYKMELEWADGKKQTLTGKLADDTLTLTSVEVEKGQRRLVLSLVNNLRFLYALEENPTGGARFTRQLETGNTREGVQFAAGASGPECIVTGGAGTMTISYKGKTFHVCCSGCKDAFLAEPEKYIAESKAKRDKK